MRNLGRAKRLILLGARWDGWAVSCSAAVGAGQRSSRKRAKSRKQTNGRRRVVSDSGSLAAIGRLTQQLGAKAARPEQRECFEALAARQRSLFSAAMNAARGTDGVPDSSAPAARPVAPGRAAGMELVGALFQCFRYRLASHQPPRIARSVARSREPEAICSAVSGARNRRELAAGD
ncbi:hypothetical protein GGI43DRAFT_301381 [Trichoderma evansii]